MDVRHAWQFPATQALLSLLSPSHSVPATTPTALEDALQTADSPLLAQLHAKLLRLPPSSQHKWRASILRYVANHPQYFDSHIPQPQGDDAYECTTPHDRLLLLHALAEAVLSEHPPVAPIKQLRPYPIGFDALKNQYWYFGDTQRVYREPGEAAKKKAEKETKVSEQLRKPAEKDARRRERKEKREAIEKRREEKRKRDAEKWAPRAAVGRSTRASRRLQQEADRQKERDKLGEGEGDEEESGDAMKEKWLLHEIGFSSDENNDTKEKKDESEQRPKQENAPRRSGRRRKPAQQSASPPAKRPRKKDPSPPLTPPPPPPPPPKRKEFSDPTLRACTDWETVSTNAHELRIFIARFEPREKLAPVERALLKRLDEILPEMDEAEAHVKREADRKAKTQFLLLNQKRSTRVQALNARREEEARLEAEREEKEREEANRIAAHERAVLEAISFLVREQSRDIRGARREFGMDDAINRDEVAIRKQEKEKMLLVAAAAPVRRSARMQRAKPPSGEDAEPKASADSGAEDTVKATRDIDAKLNVEALANTSNGAVVKATAEAAMEIEHPTFTLVSTGDGPERQSDKVLDVGAKEVPDEPLVSNGEQTEPEKDEAANSVSVSDMVAPSGQAEEKSTTNNLEDRRTTIDSIDGTAKSSPEAENGLEHERKRLRFTSATDEENISPAFTWSTNDEDKLPMRVLDKFFFASSSNFADAPLEDCEVPESNMVGFGILIPPTSTPPDVERVEISRIVEWMFEYGGLPKIWIKSEHAWYELREPAVEYQKVFVSARRKFEICARVSIMGDTMRGAQLNYGSILDYLGYPYGEMQAYQDSDVLTEKRYIVSQIELLNKRSLLQSGFIKELQKRIRAEDRKAAQERAKIETHEAALEMKREEEFASIKPEDMVTISPTNTKLNGKKPASTVRKSVTKAKEEKNTKEDKKGPKDKIAKRSPRKRGVKPVPRVVSSIINGILRAATKSYKTPRKRKPKSESGPKGNKTLKGVESPKKSVPALMGNGVKKNGSVVKESIANGYHAIGQIPAMNGVNGGTSMVKQERDDDAQSYMTASGKESCSNGTTGGTSGIVSPIRSVGKKERRVHPLMPKMVGHGMSAFVALPRPLVGEDVHRENGFSDGKKE